MIRCETRRGRFTPSLALVMAAGMCMGAAASGCFSSPASPSTDISSVVQPAISSPSFQMTALFRPSAPVAGVGTAVLQVTVRDLVGKPWAGKSVQFSASSAVNVVPAQGSTDANGMFSTQVQATTPGEVVVTVTADGVNRTASIFFTKACKSQQMVVHQIVPVPSSVDNYVGAAVGDLNGDGAIDLVTVMGGNSIVTLLNDGGGNFTIKDIVQTSMLDHVRLPRALMDMDGDGKLDVVARTEGSSTVIDDPNTGYYAIFLGQGDGMLQQPKYQLIRQGSQFYDIQLVDVTGDSLPDLVADVNDDSNAVMIAPNLGQGSFATSAAITVTTPAVSGEAAFADIDHDGFLDMVVGDANCGAFSLFLRSGSNGFASAQAIPIHPYVDANNVSTVTAEGDIALGDVTGDGLVDIVAPGWNAPVLDIYPQTAQGQFQWSAAYAAPASYMTSPALADFNGDGLLDVVVGNTQLFFFMNQGGGVFGAATKVALSSYSATIPVVADFNGDGALDVAVQAHNEIVITLNQCD